MSAVAMNLGRAAFVLSACLAAWILPSPALETAYPMEKPLSGLEGTVAFRLRPSPSAPAMRFLAADGSERGKILFRPGDCVRVQIARIDGKGKIELLRIVPDAEARLDEWFHAVLTWREDGLARLYLNGSPFYAWSGADRTDKPATGNALGGVTSIVCTDGKAKDVVAMPKALSAREVVSLYRREMPLDVVIPDSVVAPGVRASVRARLAPGGTYTRPAPVDPYPRTSAEVEVSTALARIVEEHGDAKRPWKTTARRIENLPDGETPPVKVNVEGPVDIASAEREFEEGLYRLSVKVRTPGGEHVRSLFFTAAGATQDPRRTSSSAPARKVRLFYDRTFRTPGDMELHGGEPRAENGACGAYLECGQASGDRVSTVIVFPDEAIGKACLLEMDWPDDRRRCFGVYMYEELDNSCRDHLQQGVATGDFIPPSGKTVTTRFPYWPNGTNNLFEIRTLAAGRPAAISRLRVWILEDPLPRLAVREPEGLPKRTFGHFDEDQTFENNLTSCRLHTPTRDILSRMDDYFGYTGQNALHYSTVRYCWFDYGLIDGSAGMLGPLPRRQGEWRYTARELAKSGIKFFPQMLYLGDPAIYRAQDIEQDWLARGWLSLDADGKERKYFARGVHSLNVANPDAQDFFLGKVMDDLADLLTNGVDSVDIFPHYRFCATPDGGKLDSVFTWSTTESGYDDWTWNRFREEAALPADAAARLAEMPARAKTRQEFRDRFETAMSASVRAVWLAWRARKVTDFIAKFCARVRAVRPDVRISAEVSGSDTEYADRGIDAAAIAAIPNVRLAVARMPSSYWFPLFRGMPESGLMARIYDPADPALLRVKALSGGRIDTVYSYPDYFETFTHPLDKTGRFGNYFQDADVKPHGRHFLREPAFMLAQTDMFNYSIGALPIGTIAREEETREFVRAFRALPALPFREMGGSGDPVRGRWLPTANGTYFYLVNISHLPVRAVVVPSGELAAYEDLSSGETLSGTEIALKPYELRSFLAAGRNVPFGPVGIAGADGLRAAFDARRAELAATKRAYDAAGIGHGEADKAIARAEKVLDEGRFADANRLFYVREINGFVARRAELAALQEERLMNAQGRWAVNCGATVFTRSDGKLFSPDRVWDGQTYGRTGPHRRAIARDATKLPPGTPHAALYATEAYDLDGYRFALPQGRYHVKIFAKCAWERSFKPGIWTVDYRVNGKSIRGPFDFHTLQGGDLNKPLVFEMDATVGADGVLDIEVARATPETDGQVRLLNAVEIEDLSKKEKGKSK